MNERKIIDYPVVTNKGGYLVMDDLPSGCVFNKQRTAVGATSIAQRNDKDYIICVPTKAIVVSKTGREHPGFGDGGTFGLFDKFGSILKLEFQRYLCEHEGPKKIFCTYDKLPAIIANFPQVLEYKLMIDEYHNILTSSDYRMSAIGGVLKNFDKFKEWVFVSATPIPVDFVPYKMRDIPEYIATYDDVCFVDVHPIKTNSTIKEIMDTLQQYRDNGFYEYNGTVSTEAFVFINSVSNIIRICETLQLTPDNCRIICSQGNELNIERLGKLGFKPETTLGENKLITFLTCTAYEGCDLFSKTGINFMCSFNQSDHTYPDPVIHLSQAAGRLRDKDNPFFNRIIHIFESTPIDEDALTYEEYAARRWAELSEYETVVESLNSVSPSVRDTILNGFTKQFKEGYIDYDDEKEILRVNDLRFIGDINKYKIKHFTYNDGRNYHAEVQKLNVRKSAIEWRMHEEKFKYHVLMDADISIECALRQLYDDKTYLSDKDALLKYYPDLEDVVKFLTIEDCEKAQFKSGALKNLVTIRRGDRHNHFKIQRLFRSACNQRNEIAVKNAKSVLQGIYDDLNIDATAKSTDLDLWFEWKLVKATLPEEKVKGRKSRRYDAIKLLADKIRVEADGFDSVEPENENNEYYEEPF